MDYPKSVPSVGLVDGHFVDENPATGQIGSLIPAAWGDAVTQEIINAIKAAGLAPDEGNVSQLADAIKWFAGNTVTTLTATTALTKQQSGLVLANAAVGAMTVTLPAADAVTGSMEFVLRRVDSSANVLTVAAAGADKIMLDAMAVAAGLPSTELLFAGDYLRLRSDGAGKWWCVGQALLPPSLDSGLVVFTAAGITQFTVPPVLRSGRRVPFVTVKGAGGGGGRSGAAGVGSGGGGAGGESSDLLSLAGVSVVTVTVGAKGLGAKTAGTAGEAGGASSFGTSLSATGGQGGGGNSTTVNTGGNTGKGSGGRINSGLGSGSSSSGGEGGNGGGPGPRATQGAIPGTNADLPGGGGSGARYGENGGAGENGEVDIQW